MEGTNSDNEAGEPGDENVRIDNQASNIEAYVLDRWSVNDHWTLVLGLQVATGQREVEEVTLATNTTNKLDDTYHGVNPRIGLLYHVNDHVEVFGHVSRLYEPPTLSQLEDEETVTRWMP